MSMGTALFAAAVLCLAADPPAGPVAFEFKDTATFAGRPVLQYRAIEFREQPVRPLGDRKFAAGRSTAWCPSDRRRRRP